MALVLKDRVKEQTTTTGTGTVTLGGAVSGFDTFASVGDGNTTYYAIVSQSANEWEVGLGTYTASGTTLSRDTILESSNSDAAVNFSAGTKDVFVTYPADKSVYADAAGTVNAGAIAATSLTLTTDLAVADGGTGASSLTDGGVLLGSGTGAITPMAVLTDGQMIVGDGSGDPVAESGATLRTSIGVDPAGTDNSTNVTLAGSLDYLTIIGQEITRGAVVLTTDISGTLPIANGGTNATSAGAARTALGAAASGANSDITSITGLTTDLTVAQGGTGAGTFAANGILFGNGTSAIGATAVGTSGHVLTSNGSGVAPTFQAAAAGGATDIDGLSDALTNSSGGTVGLGTGALAADDGSANLNTALGFDALNDVVTGSRNVAVGHSAGSKVTSGNNTFIGERAGQLLVTGSENTAVGGAAMISAITGNGNSAFGYGALGGGSGTSMGQNVGVGYLAGYRVTTGDGNTIVGYDNGATNLLTTGSNNIVLGNLTSASSATVSNEITLGNTSVDKFRIPGINFIIKDSTATEDYVLTVDASGEAGWEAAGGVTDIDGLSDALTNSSGATIGLGTGALAADDGSANNNTALGYQALNDATTSSRNVAVGYQALDNLTTSFGYSTAVGYQALDAVTTGYGNTAIGDSALKTITTTHHNTALGRDAGSLATESNSVMIGKGAGKKAMTGSVVIGYDALESSSNSKTATAIGYTSLKANTNGDNNTAVGYESLILNTTGSKNTALGYTAGNTTTTGSNNTLLGYDAEASSATVSNEITLGNASVTSFRIPGVGFYSLNGNVGIGTSAPAKQLSITKSALATINTLTDGATITPDFDAGQNFSVTLAGNRTLANPTNIDAGQTGSIFITQDGTGSRTLSFGSYWDFAGGTAPTLSTAAGAVDRIDYIVRTGTSIHAVATLNLS